MRNSMTSSLLIVHPSLGEVGFHDTLIVSKPPVHLGFVELVLAEFIFI